MITGGPIEFTPSEVAFILGILAVAVLLLTAPLAIIATARAVIRERRHGRAAGWLGALVYTTTVIAQILLAIAYFTLFG
jgi:hypothetical protein